MTAYDYDLQQWVQGPDAILIRRQQLTEELVLLKSPRGAEYAQFTGHDLETLIARTELALAGLENAL